MTTRITLVERVMPPLEGWKVLLIPDQEFIGGE